MKWTALRAAQASQAGSVEKRVAEKSVLRQLALCMAGLAQQCIVQMVRRSLNCVSWKRSKELAADLRQIYQASTAQVAEQRLGEFEARWDEEYLPIGQSWRRNLSRLIPFFDYPPVIRKVIYTTNAIESANMSLRNISLKWSMPIRDWKAALTRFTIEFGDRLCDI